MPCSLQPQGDCHIFRILSSLSGSTVRAVLSSRNPGRNRAREAISGRGAVLHSEKYGVSGLTGIMPHGMSRDESRMAHLAPAQSPRTLDSPAQLPRLIPTTLMTSISHHRYPNPGAGLSLPQTVPEISRILRELIDGLCIAVLEVDISKQVSTLLYSVWCFHPPSIL